jgi:hypothetical protein
MRSIKKEEFIGMDPSDLTMQATRYEKHVIGHTTYTVEVLALFKDQ